MSEMALNLGNEDSVRDSDTVVVLPQAKRKPETLAYHVGIKEHVTIKASYHNETTDKVLYDVVTESGNKIDKVRSHFLDSVQPSHIIA